MIISLIILPILHLLSATVIVKATWNTQPPKIYSLDTTWIGNDFYESFDFFTDDDPTHGRVNYVDEITAISHNLTYATRDSFIMRADSTKNITSSARGRDSVRLSSKETFTNGMVVLDVAHIPVGCGTWPAFWTAEIADWPNQGEIDILEGVNGQSTNLISLHTGPNCTMPNSTTISSLSSALNNTNDNGTDLKNWNKTQWTRIETGTIVSNQCASSNDDNNGCNVQDDRTESFGKDFNDVRGGYIVMRRDVSIGISIWFFPRSQPIPLALTTDADQGYISEVELGIPVAEFPTSKTCDIASHFGAHQIIFDTTFCGDWAGAVWSTSTCGSLAPTCEEYVDNNPMAFIDAYWEINSLKWFPPAEAASASGSLDVGVSVSSEVDVHL